MPNLDGGGGGGQKSSTKSVSAGKAEKFVYKRNDDRPILGMPMKYNAIADPGNRVMEKSIYTDLPIVTIVPGKPRFFRSGSEGDVKKADELAKELSGINDDNAKQSAAAFSKLFTQKGPRNFRDMRYYGFVADYNQYYGYVQMMSTIAYSKLKNSTQRIFQFEEEFTPDWFTTGLTLYFNKATSVSETVNTEFGESMLSNLSKKASGVLKEIGFLLGADNAQDLVTESEKLKGIGEVDSMIEGITSEGGVLDSIMGITKLGGVDKMSTIINGSHLVYPQVWQDSTFDRSYNLVFKFVSPYGDPESIFRNVLLPTISLMALALPRQSNVQGYTAPMICRIDCPGYFTSDMAVISSLSIRKAPEDMWTVDGLPQEVEISVQVKDLYPIMMISDKLSLIATTNVGYANWIDNLVGLGIQNITVLDNIEVVIDSAVGLVLRIDDAIKAKVSDLYVNILTSLGIMN